MTDSDLYGDDIQLWSERQSALLRRIAAGEPVNDQIDWRHVAEEIDDIGRGRGRHSDDQHEIARLSERLTATEAMVNELRAQVDDLTAKLANAQAQLAAVRDRPDAASASAGAGAKAQRDVQTADAKRRRKGLRARLLAAWREQ